MIIGHLINHLKRKVYNFKIQIMKTKFLLLGFLFLFKFSFGQFYDKWSEWHIHQQYSSISFRFKVHNPISGRVNDRNYTYEVEFKNTGNKMISFGYLT